MAGSWGTMVAVSEAPKKNLEGRQGRAAVWQTPPVGSMPRPSAPAASVRAGRFRLRFWAGFAAILLLVALTFKPIVQNDGVGYFVYLHSLLVGHGLDLSGEYAAIGAAGVTYYPPLYQVQGPSGHPVDFFPVGAAILAAPAYLVAFLLARSGQPPFGPPFSWGFTLASLFYGLLALLLGLRLALQFVPRRATWLGLGGAVLATPFIYYLVYDPSLSHTFSAFAVGAFLYTWWRWRDGRSPAGWFALGLLGGLMGLVRFQDGPLLLIALLDRPRRLWYLLPFAAGVVAGFSPQLAVDQYFWGTLLPQRPPGQALQPFPGHYLQVLFSSQHGIFTWSPIILLAAAGYAFVRERRLQLAFLVAFVLEVAITGASPDWYSSFSFGQRRIVSLTPFIVIGLAALSARIGERPAAAVYALLVAWNLVLIANLTYVIRGSGDPGYWGLVAGQLTALQYLPHLVSQGAVGRMLLFWPALHLQFDPVGGLVLLAGEAASLLVVLALLRRSEPVAPEPAGRTPARRT